MRLGAPPDPQAEGLSLKGVDAEPTQTTQVQHSNLGKFRYGDASYHFLSASRMPRTVPMTQISSCKPPYNPDSRFYYLLLFYKGGK